MTWPLLHRLYQLITVLTLVAISTPNCALRNFSSHSTNTPMKMVDASLTSSISLIFSLQTPSFGMVQEDFGQRYLTLWGICCCCPQQVLCPCWRTWRNPRHNYEVWSAIHGKQRSRSGEATEKNKDPILSLTEKRSKPQDVSWRKPQKHTTSAQLEIP